MPSKLFTRLVAAIVLTQIASAAADEPAGIRDADKIIFEGVEKVTENDVRTALKSDFDAVLAAHPNNSLSRYLLAIEQTTLLAYRHSGFREAKVAAKYDEQQQRLVVRVEEGPRHFCGEVSVTGLKLADETALIEPLKQRVKGTCAQWSEDRPAPFDESAKREIHKRLKDAFAAQGFFSPWFDVQVHAEPEAKSATLEITVNDEGPRAEIGKITIAGNERDADGDVLDYLDLRPGQRYDSGLANRLKARLDESGRFLGATIDRAGGPRVFDGDREIVDLNIDLRDYDHAPPLTADFSAEQKALLRFRNWLGRWSRGEVEHDLVFEGSFSAAAVERICSEMDMPMPPIVGSPVKRCDLRIVVAPNRGLLIAVRLLNHESAALLDEVIGFYPDHVVILSPQRRAALNIQQLSGNQTTFTLNAAAAKEPDAKGRHFKFMLGLSFNSKNRTNRTPTVVKTEAAVAAILSFLDSSDATCAREGDCWRLARDDFSGRLDAETGRLIEFGGNASSDENDDGKLSHGTLFVRTQQDAWLRETQKIEEQLAGAKQYDASAPWKALLEFAVDELAFAVREHGHADDPHAAVQALQKLVHRWSPPALADLWLPEWSEHAAHGEKNVPLALPCDKHHWQFEDLAGSNIASRKSAIPVGLMLYQRLVPTSSWLWPAGRDLLLCLASDSQAPRAALWSSVQAHDIGPTGCLLMTLVARPWAPQLAFAGLNDTSLAAFRRDYEPLLSGEGWLSRWILSLAEAAQSLDAEELRALPALLDEGPARELATNWLLLVKEEPEKPVANAVSHMLDAAWTAGMRDAIASRLKKLGPVAHTVNQPAAPRVNWLNLGNDEVAERLSSSQSRKYEPQKPPSEIKANTTGDTPLTQQLREAFDRHEEEIKKIGAPAATKTKDTDNTPVAERLKRLEGEQKK